MRYILAILLALASATAIAQTDKEERNEQQEEKKAANQNKVDYNLFRRQILGLKEFSEERRKIPALQKANKSPVKIVAVVDSLSDNEDPKRITGYIRQDIGDNSTNVYEVTFDRSIKKIIFVKPTGEANDEEKEETADAKKPTSKHAAPKKKKADDDDEEEEEKPSKKKQKEEDE